jgi:hypothetical protein
VNAAEFLLSESEARVRGRERHRPYLGVIIFDADGVALACFPANGNDYRNYLYLAAEYRKPAIRLNVYLK